jgi:hypothetical protein
MMKLSKARYLFGVTILLWAVMVFVYIVPIEDSRENICVLLLSLWALLLSIAYVPSGGG